MDKNKFQSQINSLGGYGPKRLPDPRGGRTGPYSDEELPWRPYPQRAACSDCNRVVEDRVVVFYRNFEDIWIKKCSNCKNKWEKSLVSVDKSEKIINNHSAE